jgi:hypothetical protein
MLIMNTLAQKDETLSLAYARGGFRFSIPVREEMLGEALVRRFAMAPEQVKQDEAAWEEIRKAASDNTDQLLSKMYGGMAPERSQEGSITAVIDIILSDVFADYTMKKSMKRKQGTIDIRKVNKILSAA